MTTTVITVVVTATVGGNFLPVSSPASSLIEYSSLTYCLTSLPQTHEDEKAHITAIPSQVSQSKKTTSRYRHHHNTVGGPTRPAHTPNSLNDVNVAVTRRHGSGHSANAADDDHYTGAMTTITITKQR
ncbi:hypothetical protein EDB89DRAFT_2240344 [Lactarius sanguifluus]|nr:hypothetical protein EDB89DRAFT_2240344 [Lactarius sanguifluus]